MKSPFKTPVKPDGAAYEACLLRKGTPKRAHLVEFFLDNEIQQEIGRRFGVAEGLDTADPHYGEKFEIALQRFLGYDFVHCVIGHDGFESNGAIVGDTAGLSREGGRSYVNESKGPVSTREEFEKAHWPSPASFNTRSLEWFEKNLPDDMCVVVWSLGQIFEDISFMMGYETMCEALYEDPGLVRAIGEKVRAYHAEIAKVAVQFKRVRFIFPSDDMGFKNGLLVQPAWLEELALPGHREIARIAHEAGKNCLLHSCGKLDLIMEKLITDVRIDAKHSFEDTIEDVSDAKKKYGSRIALLGGIDVDFLCRAGEQAIRSRVREVLKKCLPGGGYALGSGNTVANYVPVENYLAMVDEARNFA